MITTITDGRMSEASRLLIRDAIMNSMGDDLERANRAFGRMTDAELDAPFPNGTRREMWQRWKDDREKRTRALNEFDEAHPAGGGT